MAPVATDRRAFLTTAFPGALLPSRRAIRIAFPGAASADLACASRIPGVEIVGARERHDAVYISGPDSVPLAVEACRAGKDVWLEPFTDVRAILAAARRYGRIVQAGTIRRSASAWKNARDAVRRGELGAISFCRITGADRLHLIDAMRFAFGDVLPLSVAAQGRAPQGVRLATFHYPGFVASWEHHAGEESVVLHGSIATLTVGPADGRLAHWQDFVDCIRTRRRPVSDIATCVGSAAVSQAAEVALRRSTRLEFIELEAFS
jgi:predicted dehydrogenase